MGSDLVTLGTKNFPIHIHKIIIIMVFVSQGERARLGKINVIKKTLSVFPFLFNQILNGFDETFMVSGFIENWKIESRSLFLAKYINWKKNDKMIDSVSSNGFFQTKPISFQQKKYLSSEITPIRTKMYCGVNLMVINFI